MYPRTGQDFGLVLYNGKLCQNHVKWVNHVKNTQKWGKLYINTLKSL